MRFDSLFQCVAILSSSILFSWNVYGGDNRSTTVELSSPMVKENTAQQRQLNKNDQSLTYPDNQPVLLEGSVYLLDKENYILYVTCHDNQSAQLMLSVYDLKNVGLQNQVNSILILPDGLRSGYDVKLGLVQDVDGKIRKDLVMVYLTHWTLGQNQPDDFIGLLVNTKSSEIMSVYEEDGKEWIPLCTKDQKNPWGEVILGKLYIEVISIFQMMNNMQHQVNGAQRVGPRIWIQDLPIDYKSQVSNATNTPASRGEAVKIQPNISDQQSYAPVPRPTRKPTKSGEPLSSNTNTKELTKSGESLSSNTNTKELPKKNVVRPYEN